MAKRVSRPIDVEEGGYAPDDRDRQARAGHGRSLCDRVVG